MWYPVEVICQVSKQKNHSRQSLPHRQTLFYAMPFTCKMLENRSGMTRTRTGDTMIFSPNPYVLACPRADGN
jgi:hypothetical protein